MYMYVTAVPSLRSVTLPCLFGDVQMLLYVAPLKTPYATVFSKYTLGFTVVLADERALLQTIQRSSLLSIDTNFPVILFAVPLF